MYALVMYGDVLLNDSVAGESVLAEPVQYLVLQEVPLLIDLSCRVLPVECPDRVYGFFFLVRVEVDQQRRRQDDPYYYYYYDYCYHYYLDTLRIRPGVIMCFELSRYNLANLSTPCGVVL